MADEEIRKVVGYRGLNRAERDFLDRVRAKGQEIEALIAEMQASAQDAAALNDGPGVGIAIDPAAPLKDISASLLSLGTVAADIPLDDAPAALNQRWVSLAQNQLRTGMLSLERAITNPTKF